MLLKSAMIFVRLNYMGKFLNINMWKVYVSYKRFIYRAAMLYIYLNVVYTCGKTIRTTRCKC